MQANYAPSPAPGGMPTGGEMPQDAGPEAQAGWESPPDYQEAEAPAEEAPQPSPATTEAATAPLPPAAEAQAPAAPAAAPAGPPPSSVQQDLAATAQTYLQVGQYVQQHLPAVAAARQQLELSLKPYADLYQQNPQAFAELPPQVQATVQAQYAQWQQASQQETELRQAWGQVQQHAPVLQAMYEVETQKAQLNRVAEPLAYQMLAEREASRSPDPAAFPTKRLTEILKRVPPNALEATASAFGELLREQRGAQRVEQRVDDMGPSTGAGSGQSYDAMDPIDLYRLDIERSQKRRG